MAESSVTLSGSFPSSSKPGSHSHAYCLGLPKAPVKRSPSFTARPRALALGRRHGVAGAVVSSTSTSTSYEDLIRESEDALFAEPSGACASECSQEVLAALALATGQEAGTQEALASKQGVVASYHQGVYETASISRVFTGVPPIRFVRIGKPSGPASLLMVLVTLTAASMALAWKKTVTSVRCCATCHGYGINRCTLCGGKGKVGWEAKFEHQDRCPMCFGKRYINCQDCGGAWHRNMFCHLHRTTAAAADYEAALKGKGNLLKDGPIVSPLFSMRPSVMDD